MYKIVIDSCGELPEELKQDGHYETVSLELEVDGCRIKDDSTFNQLDFLRRVKESMKGPKSSCPSPEQYMDAYEGEADHVYVVTLSGGLSGSYNSAVLGKNLYEEEHGDTKKIYVFNSRSASIGETLIGMKIQEFEEAGCGFEEVVEKVEEYIKSMNTYFVLETLETLRKNGRLSGLKATLVNVLNIKPVRERDVLDYLMNELKLPKEKADFCMDFAQGNLGKAIRLATSEEYKEIIEDVTGILRRIPDMTVDDIIFAIKNMNHHKLKISDYIDLMMMWYRDILMLKITGNAGRLMFKEYYTDIRKQSAHISYEGIENVLKAMDKAKIRLEANVNFDVAMELMLLTIKENK